MPTLHHNISGTTAVEILAQGDDVRMSSVVISNISSANACTVDLWMEKRSQGKFFIMKNVALAVGTVLKHDHSMDNSHGGYSLNIKLAGTSPLADVIII